jgi:hypothetical protein
MCVGRHPRNGTALHESLMGNGKAISRGLHVPELRLVDVAAAAPATDLVTLMGDAFKTFGSRESGAPAAARPVESDSNRGEQKAAGGIDVTGFWSRLMSLPRRRHHVTAPAVDDATSKPSGLACGILACGIFEREACRQLSGHPQCHSETARDRLHSGLHHQKELRCYRSNSGSSRS